MQPYTGFASAYDIFMDNVPYDQWADYIHHILINHDIKEGLVLELGCGTGSMTVRLGNKGYDMIGIDTSEEMLSIARENSIKNKDKILYLCQDMREFELYGTVAAVISVCDSINYIMTEEDLLKVFCSVNNYLDPGGLFIFDLDTQYAYQEVLGDSTIAENRNEGSFIWENTYYDEEMINEISLTIFMPEEELTNDVQASIYRKYEETHYRRAYPLEKIKLLIEKAGLELVAIYDSLTEEEPKVNSERVYFIAREKHQAGKLYL